MLDGVEFGNEVVALVRGYVEREVAPLKAENESLKERLKALEERPAPEVLKGDPGESPDPEIISAMVSAEVARVMEGIRIPEDGKDAAGIVEALKDNGELVLTLQDGRLIRTGIRDGEKGKDGRDGIELDSFEAIVLNDDRTIELKFASGDTERVASFKWPVPIYLGVFKEGTEYERGDCVTWGGSMWHCDKATTDKPGTESWTLATKKGRDGKDAKVG